MNIMQFKIACIGEKMFGALNLIEGDPTVKI